MPASNFTESDVSSLAEQMGTLGINDNGERQTSVSRPPSSSAACGASQDSKTDQHGNFGEILTEMQRGNCHYVKQYLESPEKAKSFLHDAIIDGDSALVHAAKGEHSNIVQLLLMYGADVDRADGLGNTALIWAAREKRPDNVWHLLRYKANKDRRARPSGMTALGYAEPDSVEILPGLDLPAVPPAQETEEAKLRKRIRALLARDHIFPSGKSGWIEDLENCLVRKKTNLEFHLLSPSREFLYDLRPLQMQKTIGILGRGQNYPSVATKSGWGEDRLETEMATLQPGKLWRDEALRLAELIRPA